MLAGPGEPQPLVAGTRGRRGAGAAHRTRLAARDEAVVVRARGDPTRRPRRGPHARARPRRSRRRASRCARSARRARSPIAPRRLWARVRRRVSGSGASRVHRTTPDGGGRTGGDAERERIGAEYAARACARAATGARKPAAARRGRGGGRRGAGGRIGRIIAAGRGRSRGVPRDATGSRRLSAKPGIRCACGRTATQAATATKSRNHTSAHSAIESPKRLHSTLAQSPVPAKIFGSACASGKLPRRKSRSPAMQLAGSGRGKALQERLAHRDAAAGDGEGRDRKRIDAHADARTGPWRAATSATSADHHEGVALQDAHRAGFQPDRVLQDEAEADERGAGDEDGGENGAGTGVGSAWRPWDVETRNFPTGSRLRRSRPRSSRATAADTLGPIPGVAVAVRDRRPELSETRRAHAAGAPIKPFINNGVAIAHFSAAAQGPAWALFLRGIGHDVRGVRSPCASGSSHCWPPGSPFPPMPRTRRLAFRAGMPTPRGARPAAKSAPGPAGEHRPPPERAPLMNLKPGASCGASEFEVCFDSTGRISVPGRQALPAGVAGAQARAPTVQAQRRDVRLQLLRRVLARRRGRYAGSRGGIIGREIRPGAPHAPRPAHEEGPDARSRPAHGGGRARPPRRRTAGKW